jgi:hypothetical protein
MLSLRGEAIELASDFSNSLVQLMKDHAHHITLERLRKAGCENVRVLNLQRIQRLVGLALQRALQGASSDPEESARLVRGAQLEFANLIDEKKALTRTAELVSKEKTALQGNVRRLEEQLLQAEEQLQRDSKLTQEGAAAVMQDCVRPMLRDSFQALATSLKEDPSRSDEFLLDLQHNIASNLEQVLEDQLHRLEQAIEHGRNSSLLQRRVAKLSTSLDNANDMLRRLRDAKDVDEEGVASIYREVQGLCQGEDEFEGRNALMQEIFQLNMQLKKAIEEPSGEAAATR